MKMIGFFFVLLISGQAFAKKFMCSGNEGNLYTMITPRSLISINVHPVSGVGSSIIEITVDNSANGYKGCDFMFVADKFVELKSSVSYLNRRNKVETHNQALRINLKNGRGEIDLPETASFIDLKNCLGKKYIHHAMFATIKDCEQVE
ncbi:MAG: hypothetical protein AB7I27_09020 [Bacteriovoracaceae bacterium]